MDTILYFKKLVQRIKQHVCTENYLRSTSVVVTTAERKANQNAGKPLYTIIWPWLSFLNIIDNLIFHCIGLHLISSMGVPPIVSALVVPLVPWSKNIMLFVIPCFCHSANNSNDSFRIKLTMHNADVQKKRTFECTILSAQSQQLYP